MSIVLPEDFTEAEKLLTATERSGVALPRPGSVKRWKVTLVDRMRFTRRPRSKKRRIIKKWRKRPENWSPSMLPIATCLMMGSMVMMGSMAMARGYGVKTAAKPDPYWNEEDPSRPRWLEMHTKLWEKLQREQPEFASKCDVFRRQTVLKNGIQWTEDVPLSQNEECRNSVGASDLIGA
jgi:hypothetical protein